MTPVQTLGAYAAALAVVFGAAVGVGRAVGPIGPATVPPPHEAAARTPQGLAMSSDGYTLQLDGTVQDVGIRHVLSFTITGPDGRPLTRYTRQHDKDLHLIVVRRDLTGYQHLHPTRDVAGTWSTPLALASPGPYKVLADFTPAGHDGSITLAAELTAPGSYTPAALPPPASTTAVDDYEIALTGRLVAGTGSRLVLTVSRAGRPVTDLEPYLGALGHLVALRAGDLAYLHVHPEESAAGPGIVFIADVPSSATYRLFLDFKHRGMVRTAELTATAARSTSSRVGEDDSHDGH